MVYGDFVRTCLLSLQSLVLVEKQSTKGWLQHNDFLAQYALTTHLHSCCVSLVEKYDIYISTYMLRKHKNKYGRGIKMFSTECESGHHEPRLHYDVQ